MAGISTGRAGGAHDPGTGIRVRRRALARGVVASIGSASDLRVVTVEADASVVDASPRLIAANVAAKDPAAASSGDGRVLVLFARPDAAHSAPRGVLVTP